jgi:FlaA1/EpsC-like NDP-sugar epimerase
MKPRINQIVMKSDSLIFRYSCQILRVTSPTLPLDLFFKQWITILIFYKLYFFLFSVLFFTNIQILQHIRKIVIQTLILCCCHCCCRKEMERKTTQLWDKVFSGTKVVFSGAVGDGEVLQTLMHTGDKLYTIQNILSHTWTI